MGDNRRITHYDRTIWNYTVNIGPSSPHWPSPKPGQWALNSVDEFEDLRTEMSTFVRDIGLPFVTEHQDMATIRQTLLESPGHATNIWPYRSILAIDCLTATTTQLKADIAILDKWYEQSGSGPKKEYDDFIIRVRDKVNFD
jgi:hypothetical protein